MKVSNFSISPAMFAPGDEVLLSFTVKAESGDTIGSDGITLWLSISGYGETVTYRDTSFVISKGQTKNVSVKTVLKFGSHSFARGDTVSDFGVQLGTYGSRADISCPLTLLDAWYKPSVPVFAAERSVGAEPDDEGENLLMNIRLGKSAAAKPEAMSMYLYFQDRADTDADPASVNLTGLMDSALAAEIQTVISETLGKNSDWDLVLWFGDQYESAAAAIGVSKSFANMHLSGASAGGVCFGSFSKSTEDNPLFECHYPAVFYGGISGVTSYAEGEAETGGRWIDGKRIYRYVLKAETSLSGAGGVIGTLPSAIDALISASGTLKRSSGIAHPVPYAYYGSLNYAACYLVEADGSIQLHLGSSYSGTHTVIIVLEYTKSTGEADT